MIRALDRWLPAYLRRSRHRPEGTREQPVHVFIAVCDHFEPFHHTNKAGALRALIDWEQGWPSLVAAHHDSSGRGPRHTFFYPVEQYDEEVISRLAVLCQRTGSEVEIHLHHADDTAESLIALLHKGIRNLTSHGLLSRTQDGHPRYGFIHGNWALDNSHPQGKHCGVNDELAVLKATGSYILFADSDNTYLYEHTASLYLEAVKHQAGMAIASRTTGVIEPGAMPPLHRYLGSPILTWLINRLFNGRLTDCNSGFRCIRKADYLTWDIRSDGMEFASELLIKALKAGTHTVEIASGLRCGPPDRVAHLRTWRDGMRHLLFILSEKPSLFEKSGLFLALTATLIQLLALITGPIALGPFNIFDMHSQTLLLLIGILGTQLYIFSCSLFLRSIDPPLSLTRRLINMDEGSLFFLLLTVLTGCLALGASLTLAWARSGFSGLQHANNLIGAVHFLGVAATASFGLLSVHTLKKARSSPS